MRFKRASILSFILLLILSRYNFADKASGKISVLVPIKQSSLVTLEGEETKDEKKNEYLEKVHFYDRKKIGTGSYLMLEDIKAAGYSSIYDIFRAIPGLIVKGNAVFLARYSTSSFSFGNLPLIYIDGLLMPNVIDNIGWLNPLDVLAVEAYNGIYAPAEYNRGTLGGVILIWTKH
ncbi:TonB-dependent receptor plug domain-containing protein [Melioribacteraceae bacterium 4301-Me]|uniref:TonB-dependent receptor plug domain-containing protein n=1 Tax=Pyranulibacter aquaticus TaxID=3163344 RepID=UPI0035993FDA